MPRSGDVLLVGRVIRMFFVKRKGYQNILLVGRIIRMFFVKRKGYQDALLKEGSSGRIIRMFLLVGRVIRMFCW